MMRCLANTVDRFLNWLSPPIQVTDVLAADDLTAAEEACECFEPDDLWAAMNLPAAPAFPSAAPRGHHHRDAPPTPVVPADADPSAVSVGGIPHPDEQLIEELVADYRDFVRNCFQRRRG